MRHPYLVCIVVLLLLFFVRCHIVLAGDAGPFQGRLVDAESKEPLEGVVVLIEWRQVHLFAGSTFIDAQETLTDKDGKFYIPGIWVLNPWNRLNIRPILIIYKSGYGTPSGLRTYDRAAEVFRDDGRPVDYLWKFESGNPVFMLKKLSVEERKKYGSGDEPTVSLEIYHRVKKKWELLRKERNKEMRFLGIGEDIDSDGFGR